jgi:hypothetical protein
MSTRATCGNGKRCAQKSARCRTGQHTEQRATASEEQTVAHHHPQDGGGLRADRHANADLTRATIHGVGDESVQADD